MAFSQVPQDGGIFRIGIPTAKCRQPVDSKTLALGHLLKFICNPNRNWIWTRYTLYGNGGSP